MPRSNLAGTGLSRQAKQDPLKDLIQDLGPRVAQYRARRAEDSTAEHRSEDKKARDQSLDNTNKKHKKKEKKKHKHKHERNDVNVHDGVDGSSQMQLGFDNNTDGPEEEIADILEAHRGRTNIVKSDEEVVGIAESDEESFVPIDSITELQQEVTDLRRRNAALEHGRVERETALEPELLTSNVPFERWLVEQAAKGINIRLEPKSTEEEKDRRINDLEQTLAANDRQINDLEQRLLAKDRQINDLEQKLLASQSQRDRDLEDHKRHVAQLLHLLEESRDYKELTKSLELSRKGDASMKKMLDTHVGVILEHLQNGKLENQNLFEVHNQTSKKIEVSTQNTKITSTNSHTPGTPISNKPSTCTTGSQSEHTNRLPTSTR
jgi:hypothetical protein